jgi:hypothetical protein
MSLVRAMARSGSFARRGIGDRLAVSETARQMQQCRRLIGTERSRDSDQDGQADDNCRKKSPIRSKSIRIARPHWIFLNARPKNVATSGGFQADRRHS